MLVPKPFSHSIFFQTALSSQGVSFNSLLTSNHWFDLAVFISFLKFWILVRSSLGTDLCIECSTELGWTWITSSWWGTLTYHSVDFNRMFYIIMISGRFKWICNSILFWIKREWNQHLLNCMKVPQREAERWVWGSGIPTHRCVPLKPWEHRNTTGEMKPQ